MIYILYKKKLEIGNTSEIHGHKLVTPTDPTYIPDNKYTQPSIIDFFVITIFTSNIEAHTISELNSDHNPVIFRRKYFI